MCGIFGIINDQTNSAAQTTLAGLKRLEYRGYDSWGVAVGGIEKQLVEVDKHVGKIGQATTDLQASRIAIGHTRWATHGGVTEENSHPHLDCTKEIAIVHNGIIENYQTLKKQLITQGHTFTSETDSEVISHLIEEKRKHLSSQDAVFQTFQELDGSNAIVVMLADEQKLIACRMGSPLVVGSGEQEYYLASDIPAFVDKTTTFYPLQDGEAVILSATDVTLIEVQQRTTKEILWESIQWQEQATEKGDFPHYLLKEIFEQPFVLHQLSQRSKADVQKVKKYLLERNTYFVGCGSAFHAGLFGEAFFRSKGKETRSIYAHEFASFSQCINESSTVIAISQSGETADTLEAVKIAQRKGAKVVAILNNTYSTLSRLANEVFAIEAGPEIAVVSTKAFLAQVASLYLFSSLLDDSLQTAQKELELSARAMKDWLQLPMQVEVEQLAEQLKSAEHLFMIGKGELLPAILEMSLKIKESSYIHAEAFPAGELKHGVLSLIETKVPCIVSADSAINFTDTISSATEVKTRGGRIVGVTNTSNDVFDFSLSIPEDVRLRSLFHVVVGQLLGYYLAVAKGLDPDKPRNLAKSVTVK